VGEGWARSVSPPMGLESFPKASQGFRPGLSYSAPVGASRGVQRTAPYGCALTTHSFLSRAPTGKRTADPSPPSSKDAAWFGMTRQRWDDVGRAAGDVERKGRG
jgi:hypothetical protein